MYLPAVRAGALRFSPGAAGAVGRCRLGHASCRLVSMGAECGRRVAGDAGGTAQSPWYGALPGMADGDDTSKAAPAPFALSDHARRVVLRRGIRPEWIEQTLAQPESQLGDEADPTKFHVWKRIADAGGRALHVVYNMEADPVRITAYFEIGGLPP